MSISNRQLVATLLFTFVFLPALSNAQEKVEARLQPIVVDTQDILPAPNAAKLEQEGVSERRFPPPRIPKPETVRTPEAESRSSNKTNSRSPESSLAEPRVPHRPPAYRLGPGDTLAIIVHGVIGKFGKAPVHFPKAGQDFLPATGYPVQIASDGKLHLPRLEPVAVTGLTVVEAKQKIENAYLANGQLEFPNRTMLTLMRKAKNSVMVLHDDSSRGYSRVDKVSLTRDQQHVLGAVAAAGPFDPSSQVRVLKPVTDGSSSLPDGSIVHLKSPEPMYFSTGGLILGGRYELPRGRHLTALQAIALAGGFRQRILPSHHLTIVRATGPATRVPMRQVLNNPAAFIVHPGDQVIVQ